LIAKHIAFILGHPPGWLLLLPCVLDELHAICRFWSL
jgi:hypothetical protein